MSDLVWQIPLSLGVIMLGWRVLRAPYEIHLAESARHRNEIATLNTRITTQDAANQFRVEIDAGGYYLSASNPGQSCALPGVWLVYYDVVITNQTEKQVPLELWLYAGMRADGSWRFGEVCTSIVPAWAVEPVEDVVPFDRVLNLPGLSAVSGYCATNLGHSVIGMAGVGDSKELAEKRPFWLEVKNKLTNESKFHAMNYIARNLDRR